MRNFKRTRLSHFIPPWVRDGETYFITISSTPRCTNQLAHDEAAKAIKEAILIYKNFHKWDPRLVVLMPDHLHMIVSLNTKQFSISQIISPWKSFLRKSHQIKWQDGFFDHRIRDQKSLEEKEHYLRMNPVRANLVDNPKDWPYTWSTIDLGG